VRADRRRGIFGGENNRASHMPTPSAPGLISPSKIDIQQTETPVFEPAISGVDRMPPFC
jgi:hypothetical protein